jgi:hypothetical protein
MSALFLRGIIEKRKLCCFIAGLGLISSFRGGGGGEKQYPRELGDMAGQNAAPKIF